MAVCVAAGLVACGGDEAETADTAAASPAAAAEPAMNVDAPFAARVTLTGGPHAGTYVASAQEGACSVGANEVDQWAVQFTDDTATAGIGGLQLMIPEDAKAQAGTDVFFFTTIIGNFMQGEDYSIESRPQTTASGRGTAKVDDTGQGAVIRVEGITKDSVRIDAELRCNRVARGR